MSLLCASVFLICIMRVIYWPHLQITLRALVEGLQGGEDGGRRAASWWDSRLRTVWMRWIQGMNRAAVFHLPKTCSMITPGSSRVSSRWGWNLPYLGPGSEHQLGHARKQLCITILHFLHHEVLLRQSQSWISFFVLVWVWGFFFVCLGSWKTSDAQMPLT